MEKDIFKDEKMVNLRCNGKDCYLRKGFKCREDQKFYYLKSKCLMCGTEGAVEIRLVEDEE